MTGTEREDQPVVTGRRRVKESDLSYWVTAVSRVLSCEDCDPCEEAEHSLENVEKEMREYIEGREDGGSA